MAQDLRTYLRQLAAFDERAVRLVDKEVDPRFGITAYAAALAEKNDYPALLFDRVKGSEFACVSNLLTDYGRIALYLGCEVPDIPRVYGEKLKKPIDPVVVPRERAKVKENVIEAQDVDLAKLPIPVHNEMDGGPYLSAGVMIIRDPDSGLINAGIYRHQIFNKTDMGVWFLGAHHGGLIYKKYKKMGKPAPIAIALGHHPGFVMGSVSRVQGIGGEYEAAGALMGEALELVQAETSDLLVPAHAELILEGEILPDEDHVEGPFGEWPGHYLGGGSVPTIRITRITHRNHAIFQDIVASSREHLVVGGVPRSGSIYQTVKQAVPSLKTVHVPFYARMHCYISLHKEREADVKKAAFAALNTEQENLRHIVVVDDDIDVFKGEEVAWAIGTRFDAERDLLVIPRWNGPGGLLPTNWEYNAEGKNTPRMSSAAIVDATKPAPPVVFPKRAVVPREFVELADLQALREPGDAERGKWLAP
ncbi:2,5-furandicarboxylate decarboxylase 1 [Paenibacillus sp. UNC496MF]|uniref:UbiD family decarboxylase n=1 Tax=Paenibacillus sp. UNC496MF TaxID=1502753 RepID=UPI0008E7741B|nr:UbiD family decarboxylase [Paenibacillus sp. UNC496MF]SFI98715.1 2,5-furandicarboxylate decarboxylase 1 [Paenibacillus sp. UNC496MF]